MDEGKRPNISFRPPKSSSSTTTPSGTAPTHNPMVTAPPHHYQLEQKELWSDRPSSQVYPSIPSTVTTTDQRNVSEPPPERVNSHPGTPKPTLPTGYPPPVSGYPPPVSGHPYSTGSMGSVGSMMGSSVPTFSGIPSGTPFDAPDKLERKKEKVRKLKNELAQKDVLLNETRNECRTAVQRAEKHLRAEMMKCVQSQEQELMEAKYLNEELKTQVKSLTAQVEFLSQDRGSPYSAPHQAPISNAYQAPVSHSPREPIPQYSTVSQYGHNPPVVGSGVEDEPFLQCPHCSSYFEVSRDALRSEMVCCSGCGQEFRHHMIPPLQSTIHQPPSIHTPAQPVRTENAGPTATGKLIKCSLGKERFEIETHQGDTWKNVVDRINATTRFNVKKSPVFKLEDRVDIAKASAKVVLFM